MYIRYTTESSRRWSVTPDEEAFLAALEAALRQGHKSVALTISRMAKVDSLDIMDERNFAAKYRGTSPNTSRTNAVKWYAVFTYGDKHVAVWFLGGKESKELYALKKQIDSTGQNITL